MQKPLNEEALCWLRFKDGDREAFATLYKQHSIALIAYGVKLCPDKDLLKDQIQELFVELWNTRKNLSPTDSVRFYLLKALRYKLIRLEKKRHTSSRPYPLTPELAYAGHEDPVETAIVNKETKESYLILLTRAVKDLPLRQQEAIQLRFYQGLSNEQIAELMHMNYQSVSNLIYRALSRLKDSMKAPAKTTILMILLLTIACCSWPPKKIISKKSSFFEYKTEISCISIKGNPFQQS